MPNSLLRLLLVISIQLSTWFWGKRPWMSFTVSIKERTLTTLVLNANTLLYSALVRSFLPLMILPTPLFCQDPHSLLGQWAYCKSFRKGPVWIILKVFSFLYAFSFILFSFYIEADHDKGILLSIPQPISLCVSSGRQCPSPQPQPRFELQRTAKSDFTSSAKRAPRSSMVDHLYVWSILGIKGRIPRSNTWWRCSCWPSFKSALGNLSWTFCG